MKRILFFLLMLFPIGIIAQDSNPLNIIFVFIDDMGYGDLPLYGNAGVSTPNIDRLAEEGMHFKEFYVNSPICSPSRVAVTTGQYPLRWEITSFLGEKDRNEQRMMAHWLDPRAPSLARIFKDNGYYTAHVGKWHLGGQRKVEGAPFITDFGFDTSLTSFEGLGDRIAYLFETEEWDGSPKFFHSELQAQLGKGEITWVKRHDEQRLFVDRTLKEINAARRQEKPFYINLWFDAVHTPIETVPELRGDGSLHSQYYGLITNLDRELGRLFDHIRTTPELEKNTLIVLTSDNGPAKAVGSSGGLRGTKGTLYEGGIREPFIVWAPGQMKSSSVGKVNKNTVLAGMDLPPTLLSIAGIPTPEDIQFDGLEMGDVFLGASDRLRDKPVMWVRPPEGKPDPSKKDLAIRDGKWKFLVDMEGKAPELYDLEANPGETINLVDKHPDIAAGLEEKVRKWLKETSPYSPDEAAPWR